jgi:hypothetical protein
MEDPQQYLLDYLEEEFRNHPEVRVRRTPWQKNEGVMLRTEAREYFFPADWIAERRYDKVRELVREVKTALKLDFA